MDDRELLELAAKAAGIPVTLGCHIPSGGMWLFHVDVDRVWSPLHDDGDALRLAALIPSLDLHWLVAKAWEACESQGDRLAHIRRGIVEAAAQIGKFIQDAQQGPGD